MQYAFWIGIAVVLIAIAPALFKRRGSGPDRAAQPTSGDAGGIDPALLAGVAAGSAAADDAVCAADGSGDWGGDPGGDSGGDCGGGDGGGGGD